MPSKEGNGSVAAATNGGAMHTPSKVAKASSEPATPASSVTGTPALLTVQSPASAGVSPQSRVGALRTAESAGSPKSRRRSRSRTDSYLRKQRARAQDLENSDTTVVVVTNLREGCHEAFEKMVVDKLGDAAVSKFHLTRDFNFGFVDFVDKATLKQALTLFDGCELLGGHISVQRCEAVTPGRNPLVWVLEEMGPPSKVIVIKNLPFDATVDKIQAALTGMRNLGDFVEVTCRMTAAGQFSGMAFVSFETADRAQHACQLLTGAELLNRKVRIEYKREKANTNKQATYVPPTPKATELFAQLKQFQTGGEAAFSLPKDVASEIKAEAKKMAEFLGLRYDVDPTTQCFRVVRPPQSPRSSRRAAKLATSEYRPRAQSLTTKSSSTGTTPSRFQSSGTPSPKLQPRDARRSRLRQSFSPVPMEGAEPSRPTRSPVPLSELVARPRAATHSGAMRAKQAGNYIRQPLGPTENQGFLAGKGRGKCV